MNKKQKKMLKRIIVASILFIIIKVVKLPEYIEIPLFLVAYLEIGYDILLKAFKGIRNRQVFDENFLMAVATVGAIGLKSFDEATAVMLFYQIGEWFQSYAVGKSRKNITELMDIRPDYANVEDEDGNLEQVDPDEVEIGTIIVVKPGEKVAIDGIVIEGSSTLNTAALTGESLPREVSENDEVISGCINMTGLLRQQKNLGNPLYQKFWIWLKMHQVRNLVLKPLFHVLREFIRQPYVIVLWHCSYFHQYSI